jgi:hypothetical protein
MARLIRVVSYMVNDKTPSQTSPTTEETFIKRRRDHLRNKLRVTTDSLARELPPAHRTWKLMVLIPMIRDALERIEHGSYGFCAACDEPIDRNRLGLRPEARCCVDCETEYEGRLLRRADA